MKIQTEKITKRHNGHEWFKWRVKIGSSNTRDNVFKSSNSSTSISNPRLRFMEFAQARNFCWETYGPSVEIEIYGSVKSFSKDTMNSPHWSWRFGSHPVNSPEEGYIYLASEKELEFFTLKFGNT